MAALCTNNAQTETLKKRQTALTAN